MGLADLDIDLRFQLVDQNRLRQERFDFRADQAPFGIGGAGEAGADSPPSTIRKMRPQAATEVDGFSDI